MIGLAVMAIRRVGPVQADPTAARGGRRCPNAPPATRFSSRRDPMPGRALRVAIRSRGVPGRGLRLGPFPSVHWLCQTCRAATRQPALPDHTGRSIGDRPGAHQHR